ncbi:UDP-glucose 4-epimerase [Candidatus Desulfarcum epimagneticum]|uniref:UDP-glucose 4-epimerase n=1 Tax=uncultured Desulfobacteraceae bacterium TaxID=218296 RepID=A0A484HGV8_9BACT|nr:UDP-glucose 4-epimerase [uncultured Desulfobacteraceae bacterium]
MRHILVTGATGFIGRPLCEKLLEKGFRVRGTTRSVKKLKNESGDVDIFDVGSIDHTTDWSEVMDGIDAVFHLAARVHVMDDQDKDSLMEFRKTNVAGARKMAEDAASAGVRRIVFLSSIKVNGEGRSAPYTEKDPANPLDPYGVSKWEAERELKKIGRRSGMETVILRTPLVYGPGVKANFLNLLKALDSKIPIPFKNVQNRRSLIYVGNLVDGLLTCLKSPKAAGKTFLICDGRDVSTPGLMKMMASALGKPARLFPFPVSFIRWVAGILGKSEAIEKLCGSLSVDSSKIRKELGWRPPHDMEEGIRQTAIWHLSSGGKKRPGGKFHALLNGWMR